MTRLMKRAGSIASAEAGSRLVSAGFDSGACLERFRVVTIARDVFGVGAHFPRMDGLAALAATPKRREGAAASRTPGHIQEIPCFS